MAIEIPWDRYRNQVQDTAVIQHGGRILQITGLTVESAGPAVQIGEMCHMHSLDGGNAILGEVVGFRDERVLLMPYGELGGIGPGSRVVSTGRSLKVPVGMELLGRIVDGMGRPMDGKGSIETAASYPLDNMPPNPLLRPRIDKPLPLGIRAIDGFLTIGRGQRVGIFAGSGVGKSTVMSMLARGSTADVNVVVLIGERGREVGEFLQRDLGEEGLKRSVVVIATSDQPAIVRVKSAFVGTAIAEYFRDNGKNVLLMMDSLTRFSMAQREIGMAVGEPPVSRGYTPSVFALMPRLLERAGNSPDGSITAMYTVLVEGDDLNEPITDAARGILDGHIVLSRTMANRNHYPAIDILASISRLMPEIADQDHKNVAGRLRGYLSVHRDAQDLINIGAYRAGSNPEIDRSIALMPVLNAFLQQDVYDSTPYEEMLERLNGLEAGARQVRA